MQATRNENELRDIRPNLSPTATSCSSRQQQQQNRKMFLSIHGGNFQQHHQDNRRQPLFATQLSDMIGCTHQHQDTDLVNTWLPRGAYNQMRRNVHSQPAIFPSSAQQDTTYTTTTTGLSSDIYSLNPQKLILGCINDYQMQPNYQQQIMSSPMRNSLHDHSSAPSHTSRLIESSTSDSSTKTTSSSSTSSFNAESTTSTAKPPIASKSHDIKSHVKHESEESSLAKEKSETKASSASNRPQTEEEKLKTYLNQFVLASNVPFAYAIILVAFLITMIAATSIITILTIVLTLTGYTAYPITENTFNTSLAIGVVCASFALALVTASLIVWRRHCQAAYYYLDEPHDSTRGANSPQLSETYDDSEYGSIVVNDWAKHVQKLHADGDIGFSREFEQIQQANQKNTALTCDHSQLIENKHKNRYINIVAYDHTRVILRPPLGQKKPGYDYINANFIDVSIISHYLLA